MICPGCGGTVEDNAKFCTQCGFQFPERDQVKKSPVLLLIGIGALVVCLAMLVVGFFSVKNTDFFDIPIVSMILPDMDDELDDVRDEMLEGIEKIEDKMDELDLTGDEEEFVNTAIETAKTLTKEISLNSLNEFAENAKKMADIDVDLDKELDDLTESVDELQDALKLIENIVLWFMLVPLALAVLAGLLRSRGLTIFAMITALPFFFMFGGVVWGIIAIAGYITQIVVYGKMKKAKKAAAFA